MNWNDSFSVGVQSIDQQHKQLVQTLNDLHTAMVNGQAKQVTGPLLTKLVRYTRDHFSAEEALMRRAQYPRFEDHRVKHVDLTRKVDDYMRRFESGEITLSVHLLDFLRDWLMTHIQKDDRDYGPWLNQRGVR